MTEGMAAVEVLNTDPTVISPYFWVGYVRAGRLTSHDTSALVGQVFSFAEMQIYYRHDIDMAFPLFVRVVSSTMSGARRVLATYRVQCPVQAMPCASHEFERKLHGAKVFEGLNMFGMRAPNLQ